MKNVSADHFRKAMVFTYDEFDDIVYNIFGKDKYGNCSQVYIEDDGISICYEDDISIDDKIVCSRLSDYFGVTVTSIHHDSFYPVGIYVVYKEH